MNPTNENLRHLHWISPFFDAISQIRQFILPGILAVLGAAQGNRFWLIVSLFFLVPSIFMSLFRYFTLRYSIRDSQLVVSQGLIFRSVRTVPVERIQNIDFVQNVLHRLLGVAEVRVETAGGSGPEATLRVLSLEQIEQLRAEIFDLKKSQAIVDRPVDPQTIDATIAEVGTLTESVPGVRETVTEPSNTPLLEIPVSWLIRAGIADNRGLLILGIVASIAFQGDWYEKIDFKWLQWLRPVEASRFQLVLVGILATLAVLALLRVASAIWYVLRFYDYRLVRRGEDLQVSCGLLTRISATVPRRRIQLISIHRNLLMRWMNLSSIRIETAGNAANASDGSQKLSLSGRWFIPIVPDERVSELMSQLRSGLSWKEDQFDFEPLAPRAVTRKVRIAVVLSVALSLIVYCAVVAWSYQYDQPLARWLGWLVAPALLSLMVAKAIYETRSMGYARTEEGVVFRSGVLTRKTSMTFFEKIQVVATMQSPFDRRWKMAHLTVDTAAAGGAEHRIDIPMLDQTFALTEEANITRQAALHQPVFR